MRYPARGKLEHVTYVTLMNKNSYAQISYLFMLLYFISFFQGNWKIYLQLVISLIEKEDEFDKEAKYSSILMTLSSEGDVAQW